MRTADLMVVLLMLFPVNAIHASHKGVDDPAIIDIMIVYTPKAKNWADSVDGGIQNVIAQAMESAQLALDNSNAGVSLRLVHSAEVDYVGDETDETETGNRRSSTHLVHLRKPNSGEMDEIHNWRDEYGADLVALFAHVTDVGGRAYLLTTIEGKPARAFSVIRVQQASWTLSFGHEIGHNMGLDHHKEQNRSPGPGLFSHSAGWRWTGADGGNYCSMLTYRQGRFFSDGVTHIQIPYYSGPGIDHQSEPTGHPQDGDNARTIREVKHVIAEYRHAGPSWWTDRNVIVGALPDDYAAAIQGQLKYIATQAYHELEEKLNGGAGAAIESLIWSWRNPGEGVDDFQVINLGQLKNVAILFYDRLIQEGIVAHYPWANSQVSADDYATANLGQLKNVFSFSVD